MIETKTVEASSYLKDNLVRYLDLYDRAKLFCREIIPIQ